MVPQLSAWGTDGPWAGRRGFDSLVQAATGIAATEGSPGQPGTLPAQALDHGTGYLLAAAVLRCLTERLEEGGTRLVRPAPAGTAAWLTGGSVGGDERSGVVGGDELSGAAYDRPDPWPATTGSPLGRLRYALPPVSFAGGPADWSRPPGVRGTDEARWI